MENASKALIMAASILLGVMIISVGVALFNSFGGFSKNIMTEIEKNQVAEFNTQFLKYYGEIYNEETKENEKIKLTAHDVVSITNLASENNLKYDVKEKNENSYYVQISVKNNINFEKSSQSQLTQFIQDNMNYNSNNKLITKYFYIKNIQISQKTGRVMYVEIQELK